MGRSRGAVVAPRRVSPGPAVSVMGAAGPLDDGGSSLSPLRLPPALSSSPGTLPHETLRAHSFRPARCPGRARPLSSGEAPCDRAPQGTQRPRQRRVLILVSVTDLHGPAARPGHTGCSGLSGTGPNPLRCPEWFASPRTGSKAQLAFQTG